MVLILSFSSCGKYEKVKIAEPNMIGKWTHYSINNGYHFITINEKGRGTMEGDNEHGNTNDPNPRKWFISENTLHFSRFFNKVEDEKFQIDLYPTIADTIIELEYDTIPIGIPYMILDNRTYRKTN